jgi:hypothetical protein
MKRIAIVVLSLGLAACGADGEPIQPTANIGVSVGTNGVNTNVGVAVRKGPVSVAWSIF